MSSKFAKNQQRQRWASAGTHFPGALLEQVRPPRTLSTRKAACYEAGTGMNAQLPQYGRLCMLRPLHQHRNMNNFPPHLQPPMAPPWMLFILLIRRLTSNSSVPCAAASGELQWQPPRRPAGRGGTAAGAGCGPQQLQRVVRPAGRHDSAGSGR